MSLLICKVCGKVFECKHNKKYCSKECRSVGLKRINVKRGQLCWRCANACGGCSWSKDFTPVEGWEATPHLIKDKRGGISSYKIRKCPQFIEG